jgi:predicted N-acetyltransferase YhbS
MTVTIRTVELNDRDAILTVVRDAFANGGRDGQEEVDIVAETWARAAAPAGFDLVAVEDDRVVGHVVAARGKLADRDVLGIAPLCVIPSHHGAGIGSALMRELLGRIEAAGWPMVVLLGSTEYYSRFGFQPAAPFGITYAPVGDDPHFQLRRLAGYDDSYRGEYRYCWELE